MRRVATASHRPCLGSPCLPASLPPSLSLRQILSFDDYVLGAVNLYLDFLNLFLFILQLLSGGRRD